MPLPDEFALHPETRAERPLRLFGQNTQGVAPGIAGSAPAASAPGPLPAWVQQRLREQAGARPPVAAPAPTPPCVQPRPLGPSADPRARADRLREILDSPLTGTAPGIASSASRAAPRVAPGSYEDDPYFDQQVAQDERAAYSPWTPSPYRTRRAEDQLWEAGLETGIAASVNSERAYHPGLPRLGPRGSEAAANWVPDRLVEAFRRGELTRQDMTYIDRYAPSMQQRASLIAELEASGNVQEAERARLLRSGAPIDDPFAWVDTATSPLRRAGERGLGGLDRAADRVRSEVDERIDRLAGIPRFLSWFGGTEEIPRRLEDLRTKLGPYGFEFSEGYVDLAQDPDIRRRLQNGIVGWMTANELDDPGWKRFWEGFTLERDFLGESNPVRQVVPAPLEEPAAWTTEWLADPVNLAEIIVGILAPWSRAYRIAPPAFDFAFDALNELTD